MANIMAINIVMQSAMTAEQAIPDVKRTAGQQGWKKWLTIAFLSALALWVIIVQLGEAAIYNKQWDSALLFPSSGGEAAANLASSMLAAKEDKAAQAFSDQALDSSLTHVEALRTLGITKFQNGDEDVGEKLILLAADLSWRDSPTQAWLFERSLINGDYEQSIRHADALLRRRRARNEIFSIFTLAANDPNLADTVRQQIASNPPWRKDFFAEADKIVASQYRGFDNIINGLKNTNAPVTRDELVPYTVMLVKNGDTPRALKTWANAFPSDSSLVPANGALSLQWPLTEDRNKVLPVNWVFRSSRLINPIVTGAGEGNTPLLDLELDRRALGRIAQRALIIPPGELNLQIESDTKDQRDIRNLRWYLECSDKASNKNNEIPLYPTDNPLVWEGNVGGTCTAHNLVMSVKLGGLVAPTTITLGAITIRHSQP